MMRCHKLLVVGLTLALGGCMGSPPIIASPSSCSTLIPDSWRQPVPGADLPDGNTVGDWVAFGDAQTGQLDKANGRTTDSLAIIGRCEERDKAAVERAKPKLLGLF